MKKYFFYILLLPVVASCKKPEACINASPTTVKLGQEITFIDCSTDAKETKIDFGDGSKKKDISSTIQYAYSDPGNYLPKIEVYNNHDKKKDESMTSITVEEPTDAELLGTWQLYKEETNTLGIAVFTSASGTWIFDGSGQYTEDGISYSWTLASNTLATDSKTYQITKLYNDQLVIRFDEVIVPFFGKSYSAYYFQR